MAHIEIIAEAGEDDSNSYATLEEAQEWADLRVGGDAWLDLTELQQIRALVTATRDIDSLEADPGLPGARYSATQALAFPRDGIATLPVNLVRATIELAMSYAPAFEDEGTDVFALSGNGNIQSETVGPISVSYFSPGEVSATTFYRFPAYVQRLLFGLVLLPSGSGWGVGNVVRAS